MDEATRLLAPLRIDAGSLRLDCSSEWLEEHLGRFSVCGVRLADGVEDQAYDYAEDAVVPTDPVPLRSAHLPLLAGFIAGPLTPPGLCVGFAEVALDREPMPEILAEARRPDFRPHDGTVRTLAGHRGRLVGLLSAEPGMRTTTRMDARISQYSEYFPGKLVGMHYDNVLTDRGEGERFSRSVRAQLSDRRGLCNIGPGDRLLVLGLNMTALQLSDRLRPGDGQHVPDTRQLRTLLRNEPSGAAGIVCLVVRLAPGEMAVFPAGNSLHDGSMTGCRLPSEAVVIAGRFPRLRR
ncbi:hypothetical protein ACEZCY_32990 [Streptacidiphilus sp. N1-12]|uniref:Uncharacterized protein n=2 Tax=Streptacidiphilus alkalitolerans TaxID=3342712 RepID=A0ABV6VJW1_9ACTN